MAKRRAEMMSEFEAKVDTMKPHEQTVDENKNHDPHFAFCPQFRDRSGDEEDDEGEEEDDDEENEELAAMKEEIEAMLEDEFPPEEDPEDILNREHEEAAIQRLEMDIEERFMTDENNLALVMVFTYTIV